MHTDLKITPGRRSEERPTKVLLVQVQCEGFRCMAYQNENGNWIDFHTGQHLPTNTYPVEKVFE